MNINDKNLNNIFQNRRTYFLQKLNYNLFKGYFKLARQLVVDRRYERNEILSVKRLARLELTSEKIFLAGKTPLILCSFINNAKWRVSLARMLIENGSDIKFKNPLNGANALHYACINLRYDLIELYLNTIDFDLNECDKHGNTALMYLLVASRENSKDSQQLIMCLEKIFDTYKRYQMNCNIKNKSNVTPLDVCELIIEERVRDSVKNIIQNHEDEIISSLETTLTDLIAPLKVFRPQETINIQKTHSRPSTNCSFLDEIIHFNKVRPAKQLEIVEDLSLNMMNKDLRYNSSTPIIKAHRDSLNKDTAPNNQAPKTLKIDDVTLSIDLNECNKVSIDLNKSIDDKLFMIYMGKRVLIENQAHFSTQSSHVFTWRSLARVKSVKSNKENSKELRIYRNNDYQLYIDRKENSFKSSSAQVLSTRCKTSTWRENYGGLNKEFEIVTSMAYCKAFTPNYTQQVKLTHKAFNKSSNTSNTASDNGVDSSSIASSKFSRASSVRKSRVPDRGNPSSSFKRF